MQHPSAERKRSSSRPELTVTELVWSPAEAELDFGLLWIQAGQKRILHLMKHPFSIGQRVQLNKQGRVRMPRVRVRTGSVVKVTEHSDTVVVLLDGRANPLGIHHRYLERSQAKSVMPLRAAE